MDTTIIVAFIMGGLGLLGVFMTVLGNTSKTKSDARTALEERIDRKVGEYMDDLEERLATGIDRITSLEAENTILQQRATTSERKAEAAHAEALSLHKLVEELSASQHLADAREVMMYEYTKALRNHIINQLPPPPPTLPLDLVEWFEQFGLKRSAEEI